MSLLLLARGQFQPFDDLARRGIPPFAASFTIEETYTFQNFPQFSTEAMNKFNFVSQPYRNEIGLTTSTIWMSDTRFEVRSSVRYWDHEQPSEPLETAYESRTIWDGEGLYSFRESGLGDKPGRDQPGRILFSRNPERAFAQLSARRGALLIHSIMPGDTLPIETVMQDSGSFSVRDGTVQIGEAECTVEFADTPFGEYTVWRNPEQGNAIVKASVLRDAGDEHKGKPLSSITMLIGESERVACEKIEFTLDRIRLERIGDHYLPIAARLTDTRTYTGGRTSRLVRNYRVDSWDLNPDFAALGAFDVSDLPSGIQVLNEDLKVSNLVFDHGKIRPKLNDELLNGIEAAINSAEEEKPATSTEMDSTPGVMVAAGELKSWFNWIRTPAIVLVLALLLVTAGLFWRRGSHRE